MGNVSFSVSNLDLNDSVKNMMLEMADPRLGMPDFVKHLSVFRMAEKHGNWKKDWIDGDMIRPFENGAPLSTYHGGLTALADVTQNKFARGQITAQVPISTTIKVDWLMIKKGKKNPHLMIDYLGKELKKQKDQMMQDIGSQIFRGGACDYFVSAGTNKGVAKTAWAEARQEGERLVLQGTHATTKTYEIVLVKSVNIDTREVTFTTPAGVAIDFTNSTKLYGTHTRIYKPGAVETTGTNAGNELKLNSFIDLFLPASVSTAYGSSGLDTAYGLNKADVKALQTRKFKWGGAAGAGNQYTTATTVDNFVARLEAICATLEQENLKTADHLFVSPYLKRAIGARAENNKGAFRNASAKNASFYDWDDLYVGGMKVVAAPGLDRDLAFGIDSSTICVASDGGMNTVSGIPNDANRGWYESRTEGKGGTRSAVLDKAFLGEVYCLNHSKNFVIYDIDTFKIA